MLRSTWERLHGWKRWITLNGSGHGYGIHRPGTPQPGARGAEPGNRYVAAFLDQHLRQLPQPILDRPTEQNPEVLFWHRR